MLLLTLMLFFHWINSPMSAFYLTYLYFYHNFAINWFKYDVNICVMNNYFCSWVRIKGTTFCFIFIHCFFYLNTKPIIHLKRLNLFNKFFSLFLISNWLFLSCSSVLKEFNISTLWLCAYILKACIGFVSICFVYRFYFIKNLSNC